MRRNRFTKSIRLIAGPLSGLLLAIAAIPLVAQPASESHPGHGFGPTYDAAREVTINGTVQEVVTKRVLGSPAGTHLLVARAEGLVDAHVGPFLAKDTQAALHAGLPVQIIGALAQVNGKQYLLARQIIFGGRTIIVRNEHGALAHAQSPRPVHRAAEKVSRTVVTQPVATRTEVNGGAR